MVALVGQARPAWSRSRLILLIRGADGRGGRSRRRRPGCVGAVAVARLLPRARARDDEHRRADRGHERDRPRARRRADRRRAAGRAAVDRAWSPRSAGVALASREPAPTTPSTPRKALQLGRSLAAVGIGLALVFLGRRRRARRSSTGVAAARAVRASPILGAARRGASRPRVAVGAAARAWRRSASLRHRRQHSRSRSPPPAAC